MSLLTFTEPVEACFHGGEWDGLEMLLTAAYDRVKPEMLDTGVVVHPVLVPADWNGSGYYLRIRHEPPINYFHINAVDAAIA